MITTTLNNRATDPAEAMLPLPVQRVSTLEAAALDSSAEKLTVSHLSG